LGKATRGRRRMELLHDMKDLLSDRSRWRQDNNLTSENAFKKPAGNSKD